MDTKLDRQKKREDVITAKKKDVKVVAVSKVLYDGKSYIPSEKFLMSSDDYKVASEMGCVISEAEKAVKEEREIEEKKGLKKPASKK